MDFFENEQEKKLLSKFINNFINNNFQLEGSMRLTLGESDSKYVLF